MPAPAAIGPYAVVEELARGGMGVVYRARHGATGQEYALKTVLAEAGATGHAEAVLRLQREAQALALAEHPHVVRVHAADLTHDPPYLVLALLPGGSLADRLRGGPLPPLVAAALLAKVARAIQHAHLRGVLHRDLKPENILFDDRGEPRVVDLGLAAGTSAQDRLTRTGELLGTPAYMAPEQARGDRADARSDIHALGACLWATLVGRPPHGGGSVMAILESVLSRPVSPPSREVPGVPPGLDAIVARATAARPEARFQDAGELAEALERVAASGEAAPRRRPWTLGATLVAAAAVCGGGVGLAALSGRGPATPAAGLAPIPTPGSGPRVAERPPVAAAEPLREALRALAGHGPEVAAAVTSLLRALEAPGSAPRGEAGPDDEAAALAAALEAADVPQRQREAVVLALRAAPRAPLGAELTGLLDAMAARTVTRRHAREELQLAAALVAPPDGPGRARRLEELAGRVGPLTEGLAAASVLEDHPAPERLLALARLARALRRLDPAPRAYDSGSVDGLLFDLVVRLDSLPDEVRLRHAEWARRVLAAFPEDPAMVHGAFVVDPPPAAAWRATADRLARALDTLRPLPPTFNTRTVHGWLVNRARFALQQDDRPGLLALLRREVASPHASQVVNLRLIECLSVAGQRRGPALDPPAEAEVRAALGRLALLGGPVKGYADFWRTYLGKFAPAWFEALPPELRPTLPLRERMFFGPRPGTYLLFAGTPEAAEQLPAGVELEWVPATTPGAADPVEGFFLGAGELTPAQLVAAGVRGATSEAVERFARWFHRDLRLPTPEQTQAARARGEGDDVSLRVALDGR